MFGYIKGTCKYCLVIAGIPEDNLVLIVSSDSLNLILFNLIRTAFKNSN